jgi:capsule polysaccharide export protein KpsE/RkpR
MDINELSRCDKHGIYWMAQGGDPTCPMCKLEKKQASADEMAEVIETQNGVIEDLQNELNDLHARIDDAQAAAKPANPEKHKSHKAKTVDEVMDKKLEKHTKKALGEK